MLNDGIPPQKDGKNLPLSRSPAVQASSLGTYYFSYFRQHPNVRQGPNMGFSFVRCHLGKQGAWATGISKMRNPC